MRTAKILAIVVLVTLLAIASVMAQSSTPAVAADPVRLSVSRQMLQVIGQGLQELPAKIANPVINELQAQLLAADKEATDVAAKKAAEEKAKEDAKSTSSTLKKP